jgi:hypothetical protein
MMPLYRDLADEDRAGVDNQIDGRWGQLNDQRKEAVREVFSFLFVANAGGAAAVLSFITEAVQRRQETAAILSLAFFVIGLVMSGVLRICYFYHSGLQLGQWIEGAERFRENKMPWEQLAGDARKAENGIWFKWQIRSGWMSFGALVVALAIGLTGFISALFGAGRILIP